MITHQICRCVSFCDHLRDIPFMPCFHDSNVEDTGEFISQSVDRVGSGGV